MASSAAHIRQHPIGALARQRPGPQYPHNSRHVLFIHSLRRFQTLHDLFIQDVLFSSIRQVPRDSTQSLTQLSKSLI